MGDVSLTPARDAAERMLASHEVVARERMARPGIEGVTARIAVPLSGQMTLLIACESDAGTDFLDVYTAACCALVNAAGSAGASLLEGHTTVTGAVEVLKDALTLAEQRLGTKPECLQSEVIQRGGRA